MQLYKNIFACTILLLAVMSVAGRNYYVDAVKGSDKNNGLTTSSVWKTLAKISVTVFKPGDVIAFKLEQRFIGIKGKQLYWAKKSMALPLDEVDAAEDEEFNKVIWYAVRGYDVAYPKIRKK